MDFILGEIQLIYNEGERAEWTDVRHTIISACMPFTNVLFCVFFLNLAMKCVCLMLNDYFRLICHRFSLLNVVCLFQQCYAKVYYPIGYGSLCILYIGIRYIYM